MEKRVKGVGPGRLGGADSERMRKENFERLSERRLNDAKEAIARLTRLSNPYNYRYTEREMLQLVHELQRSIAELQAEYESNLEEQARLAPRRKTVARRAKRPATKR
jgi:uncharacterized protein YecE (DUF72 family)